MPTQAPHNGKVPAPIKPAVAKRLNSSPKSKPATAPVAAFSGRRTKLTGSVQALPRALKPAAKPTSSVKPVVTKAAAPKPTVVPQPPRKQPAPVVPRTTRSVLTPAKSTLPHPPRVQKQPARMTSRRPLSIAKPPTAEEWKAVQSGLAKAAVNARMEECVYHSAPYFGRDPFFHSAQVVLEGETYKVQCGRGREPSHPAYDETHVRKPFPMSQRMEKRFFHPCSSSRKIENRSSAAPKAKSVRFAGIEESMYRCMPACYAQPEYFAAYAKSTRTWEASKRELKRFRQLKAAFTQAADIREAKLLADAEGLEETF